MIWGKHPVAKEAASQTAAHPAMIIERSDEGGRTVKPRRDDPANRSKMIELPPLLLNLAVALGIGLLIGAERERRKGQGPARA
ncbi:MgtC/SapB family protein, partial [Bradyrhizobium sp.]|uniref:MgtC/SapB family protein n=1 Tax=Bradyrhizobium sp. TaxID=376 RepID=UPI0027341AB0